MRADNSIHLIAAAARRRQATLQRASDAIDQILATGEPVTIAAVAHTARVSRSWLYAETGIRDRIQAARNAHPAAPRPAGAQRASEASLRSRLEIAHRLENALRAGIPWVRNHERFRRV
jgi:hypothetical protein